MSAAKLLIGAAEMVESSKIQGVERLGGREEGRRAIGRSKDDMHVTIGKATEGMTGGARGSQSDS